MMANSDLTEVACRLGRAKSENSQVPIGSEAMPQFNPQLIQVMRNALEDVMTRVPLEYATLATKAYLAECILKAAAQGVTNHDGLVTAAAGQMQEIITLLFT
jgi:hypothetical protein